LGGARASGMVRFVPIQMNRAAAGPSKRAESDLYASLAGKRRPRTRIALQAICRRVARADGVLASGHVDGRFLAGIARIAGEAGVRLLITHPDYLVPALSLSEQVALVEEFPWVMLERAAYVASSGSPRPVPIVQIAEAIRATGVRRNVVSSDLGQPRNPPYPDGLAAFVGHLRQAGFTRSELMTMLIEGPANLIGLSDRARHPVPRR